MQESTSPQSPTKRWIIAFVVTPILALGAALLTVAKHEDFSVLYSYSGDTLFIVLQTKTMLDNGWWTENDLLGAPGRMEFYDYPSNPSLHIAVMKVMSLFEDDVSRLINAYFLFTFPLIAVCALMAFKTLRFSPLIGASLSLIYAFAPYHFSRGIHHFYLGCYFPVPLAIIAIAWVCQDRSDLIGEWNDGKWKWNLWSVPTIGCLFICAILGFDFPYYPVFACFLLLIAGIYTSYRLQSKVPAIRAGLLIACISFFFVANVSPNLIYRVTHGENDAPTLDSKRAWHDAERFGLQIGPLLLPSENHPIPPLRKMRNRYLNSSPALSEGSDPKTLGFVGAIGLIVLLWWLLFRQNRGTTPNEKLLDWVSILNVATLLLATTGGLGLLFNLLITPEIRAYNRISIFVSLFTLIASGVLLSKLESSWGERRTLKHVFRVIIVLMTAAGVYEGARCFAKIPDQFVAEFKSDRAFIQAVEEQVEPGGMVFQFPHQGFLSTIGPAYMRGVSPFSHVRAYAHSDKIHWSYGAAVGRGAADLQEEISEQPIEQAVDTLRDLGFEGIYIERRLYEDHGEAIEEDLREKLGQDPLVSEDGNLTFFSLTESTPSS